MAISTQYDKARDVHGFPAWRVKRREEVPTDFHGTGAMIDWNWTTANFEMRHSLTRLAVHEFHHVICNNPSFHEPSDLCKCTLCDQLCERYHLERCKKEDKINKRLCFLRCKCQTIVTHTFMYGCLAAINVLLIESANFIPHFSVHVFII